MGSHANFLSALATIRTLEEQIATLTAENETLREQWKTARITLIQAVRTTAQEAHESPDGGAWGEDFNYALDVELRKAKP